MAKTIVVGLDGASFDLLKPWVEAGDLPALKQIFETGVTGDLRCVPPPVTSPNWKAYATGKNPGKLGIFWWHNVDVENQRVYRPVDRYHDHTEYWDIIADHDEVGVIGVPTTYPPQSIDGVVVAGAPDAEDSGYTHPPSLEAELESKFNYRPTKNGLIGDGNSDACEEVLELIDTRFETAQYLLDERSLSFLQVTTFYINALHHNLWDHEYTMRGWEIIDDHLASFLEDDCNLVLMSDHGHTEIETVFNINAWLEQEGYLEYETSVTDTLYNLGINADRLKRFLVGVDSHIPAAEVRTMVEDATPQWVINRLPDEDGELGGSKHEIADWEASDAIASAQGPVYLTCGRNHPHYDDIRSELITKLSTLTDHHGWPIANGVYRADEVYNGPYLSEAPDIIIDKAPHVNVREGFGAADVFQDSDSKWEGVNHRDGIFAATGPAFTDGTIENLSILDLAPTLLHLHNCTVPSDMDGTVRHEVFADEAPSIPTQSPAPAEGEK